MASDVLDEDIFEGTPRPWGLIGRGVIGIEEGTLGQTTIAITRRVRWKRKPYEMTGEQEANARLIVNAVNSHDALVGALKDTRMALDAFMEQHDRKVRSDADGLAAGGYCGYCGCPECIFGRAAVSKAHFALAETSGEGVK